MADINQTAAWVTARLTELGNATNDGLNTLVTDDNIGNYSAGNVSGVVAVANGGTGANNAVDGLENLGGISASDVSTVGKTGDYDDLLNKPTIPTISQTYNASSADGMSGAAVAQGIAAETSRATTAEGNLNTAINNEKTRAQNAESTLNTAITTEKNRAEGVEATLTTSIGHLADNFADAYSASSTYYKGDYVIHDNVLYVANQNITTAEAWTAAHWDAVSVSDITIETAEENAKSFPTATASGAVASFPDGADGIPLKDMIVQINPVQAGSGDPSPSNVRAISGWTAANIYVCSFDLLTNAEWTRGYINANGELTDSAGYQHTNLIPVESAKSYWAYIKKTSSTNAGASVAFYDSNESFISRASLQDATRQPWTVDGNFTTPSNCSYIVLNRATDAVAYRVAKNHNSYTIQLGQTVYGGTLNPITGQGLITHYAVTYNGSEDGWTLTPSYNQLSRNLPYPAYYVNGATLAWTCDRLLPVTNNQRTSNIGNFASVIGSGSGIAISVPDATTTAEIKAWLAENPVTFCYQLATPIAYQLSPTQITTLLGQNNIWADCGDVSVTYRADPTLYIDGQIQPIRAMVASEETGTTASQAYSAGQYFILNGQFCKALVNIASGATFTLGTNYSVTTIGAELYSALNS